MDRHKPVNPRAWADMISALRVGWGRGRAGTRVVSPRVRAVMRRADELWEISLTVFEGWAPWARVGDLDNARTFFDSVAHPALAASLAADIRVGVRPMLRDDERDEGLRRRARWHLALACLLERWAALGLSAAEGA